MGGVRVVVCACVDACVARHFFVTVNKTGKDFQKWVVQYWLFVKSPSK